MKKIAFYWEKRFENNNFYNIEIDRNLSPLAELVNYNGKDNTISFDLLKGRKNENEYTILCFLPLTKSSLIKYFKLFKNYTNKKYLILLEPIVVTPFNYNNLFHKFFDKIFTWNDNLVDNKKYFKFIWPQSKYKYNTIPIEFNKKKFLTLINGNKTSFIKNELYSEREKIIRYLENKNISFDLYGTSWDKPNIKQKIFGYKKYNSYKGKINNKIEVLSKYKFNICFENMKNVPGYITEKIWDSLKAKSIPIYWGASNIIDYVPSNCFIDYREFNGDYDRLINFLLQISENQYNMYIKNIIDFLETEKALRWFDNHWAIEFINSLN